jgi:hypothetical protein
MSAAQKKINKRGKKIEVPSPVPSKKQKTVEVVYGMGSLQEEEIHDDEYSDCSSSERSKELFDGVSMSDSHSSETVYVFLRIAS